MNNKIVECLMAGVIGACVGITLSIIQEASLMRAIVNTLIAGAVGFVCYRPTKLFDLIREDDFSTRLSGNLKYAGRMCLWTMAILSLPVVIYGVWAMYYTPHIPHFIRGSDTIPILIVGHSVQFIVFGFITLLVASIVSLVQLSVARRRPKEMFPLICICDQYLEFATITDADPSEEEEEGDVRENITVARRVINFWKFTASIWLFFLLAWLYLVLQLCDTVLTVIILSANTYRLAAMTGAALGFIAGSYIWFQSGNTTLAYLMGVVSALGMTGCVIAVRKGVIRMRSCFISA